MHVHELQWMRVWCGVVWHTHMDNTQVSRCMSAGIHMRMYMYTLPTDAHSSGHAHTCMRTHFPHVHLPEWVRAW